MTIEFRCGACDTLLRAGDDKAGLRAKCPHCGEAVTTPAAPHGAAFEGFEEYEDEFSRYFGGGPPTHTTTSTTRPKFESGRRRFPCPMCGEWLAPAARRCRACGEELGNRPARRVNADAPMAGSAVASLVLGIVGLLTFCLWFVTLPSSLLAVGLGITGIKASRSGRYRGEGLAIAGLVLGVLGLLLLGSLYVFVFVVLKGRF